MPSLFFWILHLHGKQGEAKNEHKSAYDTVAYKEASNLGEKETKRRRVIHQRDRPRL